MVTWQIFECFAVFTDNEFGNMGCSNCKRLLCVLGMMPLMIYQSTVYTYDITVIAFLILGMCILVREFIRKEEKFQYRWRIAFILCMVLGCLPKAVYFPMILLYDT